MALQIGNVVAQVESLAQVPSSIGVVLTIAFLLRLVLTTLLAALATLVALFSKDQDRATRALIVLEKLDRRLLDAFRRRTPPQ